MSRGNLINGGLAILIGVLALLAIYEPGIEQPKEAPSLLNISRDDVNTIRIQRRNQETVTLSQSQQGEWQMLAPLAIAASDFRINSLLRITEQKSLGSYPADSENLSRFGLDKPRIALTLNDSLHIAFGDSTPLDQRRYVKVGDKVHLITDSLYYHLIGHYTTFIRQELLPQNASITSLTLPGLAIRQENQRWQVEPEPENYSADQVTQLIDAWKLASALQVKAYDGNKGEAVTIHMKDREDPIIFLITARSPDLVLARPDLGIQYQLAESSADELLNLQAMEKPDWE